MILNDETSIKSPLTKDYDISFIEKRETSKLIFDWKKALSIDISDELEGCQEIFMYQCNQTKLRFFVPFNISGSKNLYKHLSRFSWYYISKKWEYDIAIKSLMNCKSILEIGCGKGVFVERLTTEYSLDAIGVELNTDAIQLAQEKNIPVFGATLQELLKSKSQRFDAVCSFHVLEHVADPLTFLKEMVQLVRPGGKLIISVPNAQSFAKHAQNNLLDWPPHHMHQWCEQTFRSLTKLLPVELSQIKTEPLAVYHVDWYLGIQISRLSKNKILRSLAHRLAYYLVNPLLKKISFLRGFIVGHTLYAEFSVKEE